MSDTEHSHTFLEDFRAGRARRRHIDEERRSVSRAARVGVVIALAVSLLYVGTALLGTLGGVVQRLAVAP